MPQAKPEHRPGTQIRREQIVQEHSQATVTDARIGHGYRISLSQRLSVLCGEEVWIPAHRWRSVTLPQDGLSRMDVERILSAIEAEAARRYQAEKQRQATRRHNRMVSHRDHEDPARHATVETEHVRQNGTTLDLNRIAS